MIDYRDPAFGFPKPTAKVTAQRRQKVTEATRDAAQRAICRTRSGGRCEAVRGGSRCRRRATENHHIQGGHGRRNKGDSILAIWRISLCARCHQDHHAGLLAITGPYPFTCEDRTP